MPSAAVLGEVPEVIAGLARAPVAAAAPPAWDLAAEDLEVAVADGADSRRVAE